MSLSLPTPVDATVRWVVVSNQSGEEIPAYALMRISGIDDDGQITVAKPDTDGQTDVLVNGPVPIPIGSVGQGRAPSPCAVYYNTADGTPVVGSTWGAAAGSWKLTKDKAGAKIVGGSDATAALVNVVHRWGLASSDIAIVKAGSLVGTRHTLNLIEGSNITLTVSDNSGSDRVDVTIAATDTGIASVTVKESDGSPSVAATTIAFDQDQGFTVTDEGGGLATVSIADASATQTGVVNTTTQTLHGLKSFPQSINVGLIGDGGAVSFWNSGSGLTGGVDAGLGDMRIGLTCQEVSGVNSVSLYLSVAFNKLVLATQGSSPTYPVGIEIQTGSSSFAVGQTGADGLGNSFTSGLLTTKGTGLTTIGDLLTYQLGGVTRLGVGADGKVLTADSGQPTGLKWGTAGSGTVTSIVGGSGLTGGTVTTTGTFAIDFGTGTNQVRHGDDAAYTNARTPTSHHTTHESGGSDAIKLDDLAAPDDNTDLNASTSAHGLLPKLSGSSSDYLDGSGAYSVPAGSYTDEKAQDAVGGIITDSSTINFNYNDGLNIITGTVISQMSITDDASGIKLSGDSASPGNNKVYGTDGSGVKGWQSGGTYTDEQAQDAVAAAFAAGTHTGITITYTDASNKFDLAVQYGSSGSTACVGNDSRLSDSRAPNGSAGGDLTGTYPNPTIGSAKVTYAKIQNVSATSRILGRKSASAGSTEECTLSEVLDFVGSAAQGDILYRNATSWVRLGTGSSGQFLTSGGAGANLSWTTASGSGTVTSVATAGLATGGPITGTGTVTVTAAVQADMEAASSTTTAVTPAVMKYHPGVAKAWARFNGTGTPSFGDSYNCSSITDNGTGDWTINWSTAFSGNNYAPTVASARVTSVVVATTTGGTQVQVYNSSSVLVDEALVTVHAFGDQ